MLSLCGRRLVFVDVIRYLGIWLDHKLTFKRHIAEVRSKVCKRIAMARALVDNSVGLTMRRFIAVYTSCVRPCMEFASAVWSSRADISSLESLQLLCLRIATGARRSTPANALEVWTGVPPLATRFAELRCRLLSRTLRLPPTHPLRATRLSSEKRYQGKLGGTYCIHAPFFAAHTAACDLGVLRQEISYRKQEIDLNPPLVSTAPRPAVQWDDSDDPDWPTIQAMFTDADTILYTDGSVEDNPGRGGSAVYGTRHGSVVCQPRRSLGGMVTISFAELTAIDMAVTWALSSAPHARVFILTDSKYALFVIKDRWKVRKYRSLVASIRNKMSQLRALCDVRLYKVKAHDDVTGNDNADRLAKQAMRESTPAPHNPVDYDTAKVLIHRAAVKDWQSRWHTCTTQLRSILPKVAARRRRHLDNCSRRTSTVITQLATGHFPVARYLSEKLGHRPSPCACGLEETIEHLLLECQLHEDRRTQMLDSVQRFIDQDEFPELTLAALLYCNKNRRKCYVAVLRFLSAIDRMPF